jgi:hypothetical protein
LFEGDKGYDVGLGICSIIDYVVLFDPDTASINKQTPTLKNKYGKICMDEKHTKGEFAAQMMGSTHSNPEYYTQNIVLTFHNR